MTRHAPLRLPVLTAVSAALLLAGCGGTSTPPGPMGGGGMMSGGPGYHLSRLICAAPSSLPGNVVRVQLADMGMTRMMGGVAPMNAHMRLRAVPASVPAGQVSLVASNVGWRTHELVVLPLAPGAVVGTRVPGKDGKVDEAGSLGEASRSCAGGTGEGIVARTVGWTTLTLRPGRYELVCNLVNHYADGMYAELVVR
ncbi:MAG: hypothetical protein ACXVET_16760 [Nocardioidaceae bacterium]